MRRYARYELLIAAALVLAPIAQTAPDQGTGADPDGDGLRNSADNCDVWPNSDQADADANEIGDGCECGDQDGSGGVDVRDLVAINLAIFVPAQATPLCDTNYDDLCDVRDIIGSVRKIFGQPAYCSRYPPPGPSDVDADGDGFTPAEGDCDDTRVSIAPELTPIDPNALAPVVAGACEEGALTPNDCNPGACFDARGPFRDFRETDGCSNPAAIDPNNPSGPALCPFAAFATGNAASPRGCDLHDFCYRTCGSDKNECDEQQLRNHLAICNSLPVPESQPVCIELCRGWAQTYFQALQSAPAHEAWTRNQGLYCSCCGIGDCGDGACDPEAGERPRSCPQDCPPAPIGAACVVDADCASGQCSFSGRCIQCGNGVCEAGEFCGASPGCQADCGLCSDDSPCRADADCQSGFCDLVAGFCRPCQSNGTVCLRDSACCNDVCNNTFLCASCKDLGQGCLTDDVCCSNLCNNAFQCATCKDLGQGCLTNDVCCSNVCNSDFECASCRSNGEGCLTDDVCCSDICNNAFQCASCKSNGQGCLTDGVCCSDICNNAFQCASCKGNGQGCLTDGVCCSNICDGSFQCAACRANGESCLRNDVCCSGLCNGAFVCATCKTFGGTCSVDQDCCSGNCSLLGLCGL